MNASENTAFETTTLEKTALEKTALDKTAPEKARRCPRCGSDRIHHSHRRGAGERLLWAIGGQIRRCHACASRQAWFDLVAIPLGQGHTTAGPLSGAAVVCTGLIVFLPLFWWIISRFGAHSS